MIWGGQLFPKWPYSWHPLHLKDIASFRVCSAVSLEWYGVMNRSA
jgi:hypothetical protein